LSGAAGFHPVGLPGYNTTMSETPPARKLFGTDGIRGKANAAPMDAATALRLGQAAGSYFNRGNHRHRVVIGKDTRLSGYMLEPALTAGFIGAGMDVVLVGPLPTPAIALLTRSLRADLGVMISASHNPYEDNGIKLFGPDGLKLTDDQEAEIEALMAGDLAASLVPPARLGRASRLEDAPGRYIEAAKASFPRGQTLDGLRIVVDCAHGAGYRVAPTVLWELGAEVIPIGVAPDGFNINKAVGSTAPAALATLVRERRADLGIALDGDADRVVLVDEAGQVVDGDQILALIARSWHAQGRLTGGAVVATVMSNMGLERFLSARGLGLLRTAVGDRYVGERMREAGCNLGGEQSGHMIMPEFGTTGDGLIAALQVLSVLVEEKRPASEVLRCFAPLPQRLVNVRYAGASPLTKPVVAQAIAAEEAALGARGRVLIRASGTEPVIRVMAEAEEETLVEGVVGRLADLIKAEARVA
jgi:phosphoglucosamine mutase